MKVTYTFKNNAIIEVEGDNQQDVFDKIASLEEVFSINKCGKCQSDDLKFVVRNVGKYTYRELHCRKCWAKLSFSTHSDDGTMFPKRRETVDGKYSPDGKLLPDGGWMKWNAETQTME
jgi:hypothetical protein